MQCGQVATHSGLAEEAPGFQIEARRCHIQLRHDQIDACGALGASSIAALGCANATLG